MMHVYIGYQALGRAYLMTPNLNCITSLYQSVEALPFPIGSSSTAVSKQKLSFPEMELGLGLWIAFVTRDVCF